MPQRTWRSYSKGAKWHLCSCTKVGISSVFSEKCILDGRKGAGTFEGDLGIRE